MAIKRFRFFDKRHGWKLQDMSFSQLNLLVGKSGAGKTRILNALESVREAGLKGAHKANGCQWEMEIQFENQKFLWKAETSLITEIPISRFSDKDNDEIEDRSNEKSRFLSESIIRDDNADLVARDGEGFRFNLEPLPKLKSAESAISLLGDEKDIAPLNKALRHMIFSRARGLAIYSYDIYDFKDIRKRYHNLKSLKEARNIPPLVKGFILQEEYRDEFEKVKNDYMEIFDTVEDLKIGKLSELDPRTFEEAPNDTDWLVMGIKETGVDGWIVTPRISSGMFLTFHHLLELLLSPPETVILIDELENSLGVNCLPELTDRFLRRSQHLQLIATSHHPYVIQNIPSAQWGIVTRKGSEVAVIQGKDIPALDTRSGHDRFMRLLNLKEYEDGIQ
ncbi:conserved hypothetical protein [Candidatus Desulfarcum epimagneticum]|uniref:ATPase AAA-type core domain-containing protein n=1 Tax=uncultured Desulfobacteraceae bacterium TaxID=218296 RepID=A0A484HJN1_9BACT|nr:conserved hypothetical protein [uncultured Desulfobacteraceae bacterium]